MKKLLILVLLCWLVAFVSCQSPKAFLHQECFHPMTTEESTTMNTVEKVPENSR